MFLDRMFSRGNPQDTKASMAASTEKKTSGPMTREQTDVLATELQKSMGYKDGAMLAHQPKTDEILFGVAGAEKIKTFKNGTWRDRLRNLLRGMDDNIVSRSSEPTQSTETLSMNTDEGFTGEDVLEADTQPLQTVQEEAAWLKTLEDSDASGVTHTSKTKELPKIDTRDPYRA